MKQFKSAEVIYLIPIAIFTTQKTASNPVLPSMSSGNIDGNTGLLMVTL